MRFTDGFRLAELAGGDEGRARTRIASEMREALEAGDPTDRARWLTSSIRELRRPPVSNDERAAAILGASSSFAPRRRYRPPPGLRQHLTRWLRAEPTSVRAKREIDELEGQWDG